MADYEVSGRTSAPFPKPKPAAIAAARQQALSGAIGNQAGGVASALGQAGGTPSAGCAPGTPGGAPAAPGENPVQGPTTNAPGSLSGPLGGVNPAVQNMVRNSIPAGCRAQVTPNGGVGSRSVGGSAHPRGLATDTNLYCGGKQQFAGSPKMNEYIYNLNKNGARGLSYYSSGFVHADLMGQRQRRWGPNQAYLNSATRGENPGPGAAQAAQGGAGGGGGDPCGGGGGGGCQPVQSSAPQIAAGLAQNLGMDVPSMVSGLASALTGGSPIAGLMSQATSAVQGLLNQVGLGGIPLSPAALADPTSAISKIISDKVASMGANIMPSIVGNLPGPLAQGAGMAQGLISDKITSTANQIFSKSSPPKLDRFISVFNAANAAQAFSSSLQETIGNTLNNVFGNAGKVFQSPATNNWAKTPSGVVTAGNPYVNLESPDIGEVKDAVDNTINRSQFIGDPETVLNNLIKKPNFNAFSSMFYDWDAYVTRGYGTITNNVIEFGTDLKGLGKLADLNDIIRIGTPGQIAQQIILNGGGTSIGLSSFMIENKLSFSDLSNPTNDKIVYEFLTSVNDAELLGFVKEILEMDETINLETLGDLLESRIILPRSYDYNYFENLNDIAVFLSICNGGGAITTLKELGTLIESFEVPFDSTTMVNDPAIYNYRELTDFAAEYAPVGFFTSDGSLSIADFIGTAAGYVHDTTIPRIAELQSLLVTETTYFDDYLVLVELLSDAASGLYQVLGIPPAVNTVVIPDAVGYTFGTYATLDDAISDIVDAIEFELVVIQEALLTETDDQILEWIRELDSLHTESSMQLAREHKLRKEYGFKLGPTKSSETFIGDGITTILPLSNDIDIEDDFNVFVGGVWQSPSNYTVDAVNNKITLSSAPAVGIKITVNYKTGAFEGIANKMQVWDFASNLENLALETGYGRSADFLRRVVTNDEYGQRINATLMNARNKARSEAAGLNCPNFETVNGAAPTYINYVDWTGMWTSNPSRASEIWLQNNQEVDSLETYLVQKIQKNKDVIQPELDIISNNIVRQLLFFQNGNIVISDLMAEIYQNNQNKEIYAGYRSDLIIPYSNEVPNEGYILGNYREIISDIASKEGMQNSVFVQPISSNTEAYLKDIGVDMGLLITIVQRILMVNLSNHLGINEGDAQNIFGIQSVAKSLMFNIANNY